MTTPRGTTDAELGKTLGRIMAQVRKRVDPGFQRLYRCSGGCEDTGFVTIDDGLNDEGKRMRAAVVRPCGKCAPPVRVQSEPRGGSFS